MRVGEGSSEKKEIEQMRKIFNIGKSFKKSSKNYAKTMKNHAKIDLKKGPIFRCPGPAPPGFARESLGPVKQYKINKTHTDIPQKAT